MTVVAGAFEQEVLVRLREVAPGRLGVDPVRLGHRLQQPPVVHRRRLHPRLERALGDRERRVRNDQLGVDDPLETQSVALRAAAVRRVEREDPRLELRHGVPTVQAGEALGEQQHLAALPSRRPAEDLGTRLILGGAAAVVGPVEQLDLDQALGELGCGLDRLREALAHALLHDQAIHNEGDVVLVLLVEHDLLVEAPQLAVDHRAGVPLLAEVLQHPAVLALALTDDGSEHHEARALLERHHAIDDLLDRLPLDRFPAVEAMRLPDAGPEEPEVVVDLRDRPDGGAGVARGRLLVDGDRRGEPLDRIHVGLLHLPEELAGVGGERLHVAALALGVDRVEREAGLTRSGEPRDHHQGVAGQADVDPLQVVRTGTRNDDLTGTSHCRSV